MLAVERGGQDAAVQLGLARDPERRALRRGLRRCERSLRGRRTHSEGKVLEQMRDTRRRLIARARFQHHADRSGRRACIESGAVRVERCEPSSTAAVGIAPCAEGQRGRKPVSSHVDIDDGEVGGLRRGRRGAPSTRARRPHQRRASRHTEQLRRRSAACGRFARARRLRRHSALRHGQSTDKAEVQSG